MQFEKRATNKIGLTIFIIIVLISIIGGAYYLFTHKDQFNIDWNMSLPWKKETEEDSDSKKNSTKDKKSKNQEIIFEDPKSVNTLALKHLYYCSMTIKDMKNTAKELILIYEVQGSQGLGEGARLNDCTIEVERYVADGYAVSGTSSLEVKAGESKSSEIRISKAELEAQEISGIKELELYIKESRVNPRSGEIEENRFSETVNFYNERSIKNEKNGMLIDRLADTAIEYYKTTTDGSNTYLYFIANNQSKGEANLKVRKLIINEKVFDTKDVDVKVASSSKKVFYIAIPKSKFKNVNSMTISFFNIAKDQKDNIQYLISNEYSRKY